MNARIYALIESQLTPSHLSLIEKKLKKPRRVVQVLSTAFPGLTLVIGSACRKKKKKNGFTLGNNWVPSSPEFFLNFSANFEVRYLFFFFRRGIHTLLSIVGLKKKKKIVYVRMYVQFLDCTSCEAVRCRFLKLHYGIFQ